MRDGHFISVIVPALNEEESIGKVIAEIPDFVDEILVADNGSTDRTVEVVKSHGARVVREPTRGYGAACLRGIAELNPRTDIVVFLDGDYSDYPQQMTRLVDPIVEDTADLVIGSRALGDAAPGALTPQARFGNRLACFLMRLFWGVRFTDLGPFRAIRYSTLKSLGMRDPDYGWTVEMQIKATLTGARSTEAPVDYRRRIGRSKVSGTVRGVIGAGYKILSTIFISALRHYASGGAKTEIQRRLVIFTRYPTPGETKTRMVPALGEDGAAELQRQMTERMVRIANSLVGVSTEIWYTGSDEETMRGWLGGSFGYREQPEGDLGHRMATAFEDSFAGGARHTVIIGVDCPEIDAAILHRAFDRLADNGLVLGPATDGGYYLIGLNADAAPQAVPGLFEEVDWGTDTVLETTLRRARGRDIAFETLAPLDDVDRPEDIAVWERATEAGDKPALSVIIPALNEEDRIADAIASAQNAPTVEVIVVDGGSTDRTRAIARELGAQVIESPRGRARQMNLGSARARANTVMFLHADTRLPADYLDDVESIMAHAILGAFEFETDMASLGMRVVGFFANLRSRYLQLPYGDQALFLKLETFRALGGFRDGPIMEDFILVREASRRGPIAIARRKAVTCGRRWRNRGTARTALINSVAVIQYLCGVSTDRIAVFYGRSRGLDKPAK